jgi:acyl-CoA synthetase (NDP forming)
MLIQPMKLNSLDFFFSPRSVAIIGASPGKTGFANLVLANLKAHRYAGPVSVIHPGHAQVDGFSAWPSIAALPHVPDHCVIAVRAELVAQVLRECVTKGIPAVTIIAAGFAEMGAQEGVSRQRELKEIVSGSMTRVLGPNCIGMGSFANGGVTIASANIPAELPVMPVAIVSQSGGVALALMLRGVFQGMGLSHFVSVGNELDASVPDFLLAMAARDDVKVVICYLEGTRDAVALRCALEACSRALKPVILLRGGLTSQGKAAAASHTGSLSGDGAVWRGFIAQVGAIEATTIDHAIAIARFFARFGLPGGQRVGGFAGGGGMTVLFTDMLARAGLQVPDFTEPTRQRIRAALPDVTPNNPMDMGGMFLSGDGSLLAEALAAMATDPNIDLLALCMPPYLPVRDRVVNGAVLQATRGLAKPVVVVSYAVPGAPSVLRDADCFLLEPPEPGLLALKSWLCYAPTGIAAVEALPSDAGRRDRLRACLSRGRGPILEDEGKSLLAQYGVTVPAEQVVVEVNAAVAAAGRIGYPVAMKILSTQMLHRGLGRGVIISLNDETAVSEAFATLQVNAAAYADARLLVQAMAPKGYEFLIGATRDPELGLALAVGVGGANVEAAHDVLFALPPVDAAGIARLLEAWPTLAALEARSGPIDRAALIDAVARISALLVDGQEFIEELDVNPLIVGAPGQGAVAVDALFILREPG